MSLLWSGVSETPSLAWHVVIYNDGEYIPVIICIGYKQNHGADPDWRTPYLYDYERLALAVVRATMSDTFCSIASIRVLSGVYNNHELYYQLIYTTTTESMLANANTSQL